MRKASIRLTYFPTTHYISRVFSHIPYSCKLIIIRKLRPHLPAVSRRIAYCSHSHSYSCWCWWPSTSALCARASYAESRKHSGRTPASQCQPAHTLRAVVARVRRSSPPHPASCRSNRHLGLTLSTPASWARRALRLAPSQREGAPPR